MYNHVIWPPQYDPRISPIYALNDIDVNASPEVVWRLLVDAAYWSNYFPPENQVRILSGEQELQLGTKMSRVTIGFVMYPIVTEYVPGRRLAWVTTVEGDETGQPLTTAGSSLRQRADATCSRRRRSKALGFWNNSDISTGWTLQLSPGLGGKLEAGSRSSSVRAS